jgi:hypothetical protein
VAVRRKLAQTQVEKRGRRRKLVCFEAPEEWGAGIELLPLPQSFIVVAAAPKPRW